MRLSMLLLSLAINGGSLFSAEGDQSDLPSIQEIREMLQSEEYKQESLFLKKLGSRAFPLYLEILNADGNRPEELGRIFGQVTGIDADRSQFLEHAVRGLAHRHWGVRESALRLLAQIGHEPESVPVVALLFDERREIVIAAATTLVAIGKARAVTALDIWLKTGGVNADAVIRRHVEKCRNDLKQRLEKQKSLPKK